MGVQWSVGTMFDLDDPQQCDFCHEGRVITRKQQLAFQQWTVRGYIHCGGPQDGTYIHASMNRITRIE